MKILKIFMNYLSKGMGHILFDKVLQGSQVSFPCVALALGAGHIKKFESWETHDVMFHAESFVHGAVHLWRDTWGDTSKVTMKISI